MQVSEGVPQTNVSSLARCKTIATIIYAVGYGHWWMSFGVDERSRLPFFGSSVFLIICLLRAPLGDGKEGGMGWG